MTTAPAAVELIPRAVLFGNPERTSPRLSPDGRHLAWIAPDGGVLNVWVAEVDAAGGIGPGRVVTADRDRGVRLFFWAPDDLRILFLQDAGGDENWRLYDVELATGTVRDLTPFPDVQVQVVQVDLDITDRILVAMNKDDARLHDVYELELASGTLTKVLANPGLIGFVADRQLRVRAAVAPKPDGGLTLLVRDGPAATARGADPGTEPQWRPLLEIPRDDALTTSPLAYDSTTDRLLAISSVGANAARLVWLDAATGAEEVLAEDPAADVSFVWLERGTRRPQLVAFQRERRAWQVLDDALAADLAALTAEDDGDLSLLGRTRDDRTWVVAHDHADGPTRFLRYRRDDRSAEFLFENRPALAGYPLAQMEPFSFTSRDGLTVHGYLTFPAGAERRNLPAVVDVHGGPWARDVWGFTPEAQWLANRGYLCVQVNFRGSTGYGKDFVNAGDREWAGRMHDDLLDAVEHVVGAGYADRSRIAIYGGSYGGYAALVGATFTPDVFCCAVDIVGPSNLATLIASIPPYWEPMVAQFHQRVGNPETEADFMWSRSPLSRVDAIRIPLLIAQGANDPRVKQAESEQIVAALTEKGIPHEYLLYPDEGHGFAKPENRLSFYAAAERFLATHLGGRFEA